MTHTCATGYRGETVQFIAGSPTVTLPPVLFPGQTFDLTIWNASGAPWGFGLANYGSKETQSTVNNNTGASARFVASDPTGSLTFSWNQVGAWSYIAP